MAVSVGTTGKKGKPAAGVTITKGGASKTVPRSTTFRGSSRGAGYVVITTAEGEKIEKISAVSTTTGEPVILSRTTGMKTPVQSGTNGQPTKTLSPSIAPTSAQSSVGIYDTVKQQTRIARPIESELARVISRRTGESVTDKSKVTTREELLNDPRTKYVYFESGENFKPLVVEQYPYVVNKKKEYSIISADTESRKPSKLKALYEEAKAGFEFESSPSLAMTEKEAFESTLTDRSKSGEQFGRTEAGARRVSYTAGSVIGIASLSPKFWERGGAVAANIIYKNARVFSVVQKTSKVLSTKPARMLQGALIGSYVTVKGVEAERAYEEEGTPGVARVGLGTTRTFAAFSGASKGFKSQVNKNIKETTYLVKGEAKASTLIKGDEFETTALSKGKIQEIYKGKALSKGKIQDYKGKVRREFDFKDVTKGAGKTKEIVRVIEPERTRTTSAILGQSQSRTSILGKVRTKLSVRSGEIKINPRVKAALKPISDTLKTIKLRTKLASSYYVRQAKLTGKSLAYGLRPQTDINFRPLSDTIRSTRLRLKLGKSYYGRQAKLTGKHLKQFSPIEEINYPRVIKTTKPSKLINNIKTSADIKAVQKVRTSKPMEEIVYQGEKLQIGIGASRFKFEQGKEFSIKKVNVISKVSGGGESSYVYTSSGRGSILKGEVGTVDKKVFSQFKFREKITSVPESSGKTYNLGGGSLKTQTVNLGSGSLRTQAITSKVSQNLASQVKKLQNKPFNIKLSPVGILKEPTLEIPTKVLTTSRPKENYRTLKYSTTRQIIVPVSIPEKTKQITKSRIESIQLIESDTESLTGSVFKTKSGQSLSNISDIRQRDVTEQKTDISTSSIFLPKTEIIQEQRRKTKQDLAYRQRQLYEVPPSTGRGIYSGFIFEPLVPKIPTGGSFPLPKRKGSKTKSFFDYDEDFSSGYSSSVEAILLDIRGKRPKGFESGLVVRPLRGL